MKKIFISLIFLLIANHSFAETILDFAEKNKNVLDEHYKCQDMADKSKKQEIGFKEVNGRMFAFFIANNNVFPMSSVRIYKNKVIDSLGERDVVSFIFAFPTNVGLAGGIFMKDYHFIDGLEFILSWIKEDSPVDWVNEHSNLFENANKNIDKKLIDYSEKALDLIFTKLDFGEPFEPDDAWSVLGQTEWETGNLIMLCK